MQKKFESIVNSLGAPTYRGEKYAIYKSVFGNSFINNETFQ